MSNKKKIRVTEEEMGEILFHLVRRSTLDFIEDDKNLEGLPEVSREVLLIELMALTMFIVSEYSSDDITIKTLEHMHIQYYAALKESTNSKGESVGKLHKLHNFLYEEYRNILAEYRTGNYIEKLAIYTVKRLAEDVSDDASQGTFGFFNIALFITSLVKHTPAVSDEYEIVSKSRQMEQTRQETKTSKRGFSRFLSSLSRPVRIIATLVIVGLVYGIVNLVLVGGQKLWHHDDEVKLEKYETVLKEQKNEIDGYTTELEDLKSQAEDLKEQITGYETDYPYGIPEELYADYEQMVDEYNSLADDYDVKSQEYSDEIDSYNDKVEEANALAEEVGSTWYVVPVGKK
ncbi:hypothetical protein [Priestia aryabhattai]|uniref:hypothetical protein n=1 Tax=Priestia aryabhattai TaxID=412384 RepID=UPI001ADBAC8A|nr:hypothetical protein [Priestia aryabhattai]QTL49972.1 hypothetical protein J5Z55_02320 [Priestia aryabhattai]